MVIEIVTFLDLTSTNLTDRRMVVCWDWWQ